MSTQKVDFVSVAEALSNFNTSANDVGALHACDVKHQTKVAGFDNRTDWSIEIGFIQLKSDLPVPPGYTADTGVFVAATDSRPHQSVIIEPCKAGGRNKPIMAAWVDLVAKLYWVNPQTGTKYTQDIRGTKSAPEGSYLANPILIIAPKPTSNGFVSVHVDWSSEIRAFELD